MKHLFVIIISIFALLPLSAISAVHNTVNHETETQKKPGPKQFDPQKYQDDLESFITKEAKLTPQEAQAFFPLFREMQQKLRGLYKKQRQLYRTPPTDENAALEAIKNGDCIDIKIKKILQTYHQNFLKVLPATKVLACIRAEEHFNRNMMRNMGHRK